MSMIIYRHRNSSIPVHLGVRWSHQFWTTSPKTARIARRTTTLVRFTNAVGCNIAISVGLSLSKWPSEPATPSNVCRKCALGLPVTFLSHLWPRKTSQSINRSINLFVQKCNTHSTGHQGRTQPPLTGAHKNKVSTSNRWQYLREREGECVREREKTSWHKFPST